MKSILAIGGAVIKTALPELFDVIKQDKIEMLIHNGGSIFHDFQLAIDNKLEQRGITSYPLTELKDDFECNRETSRLVWKWIKTRKAPKDSVTNLCYNMNIPVLMFSALGTDFWQLFREDWSPFAKSSRFDYNRLRDRMKEPFHYLLMGSAVIHPEVFIKVLSEVHTTDFKADVVDFLEAYRPRTRVARYGEYFRMTHKEFLANWSKS
jgi:hypothetical protein